MTPFFLVIARLCLLWPWQSPSFEGGGLTPFDTTPEDKTKRTKTIEAIASSLHFVSFLAMTGLVNAGFFAKSAQDDNLSVVLRDFKDLSFNII